jgi:hypothetical protein
MTKKFVSIFLALLLLNGSVHLDELVKLRFLLEHFKEHKAAHPEDSLTVFLYKHYILNQKAESQKDKKSDTQLPFKSAKSFTAHFSVFCLDSKTVDFLTPYIKLEFSPCRCSKVVSNYTAIWQPPKLVLS